MAGPGGQRTEDMFVAAGESDQLYSPAELAYRIVNLALTPDGYLESVTGPAPLIANRGGGYPNLTAPHGLCFANLLGGIAPTLVVRHGTTLKMYQGGEHNYVTIGADLGALTSDRGNTFPDQWVVLNDKIIWCNGIDEARVIQYNGMTVPLGFSRQPGAPIVEGPQSPSAVSMLLRAPNSDGYSWPGRNGTLSVDADGLAGRLLSGERVVYQMWEDIHGNLSAPSIASAILRVDQQRADPYDPEKNDGETAASEASGATPDMLLRQYLFKAGADAPDHAVAIRFYMTTDLMHTDGTPRLAARFPNARSLQWSCALADGELGDEMPRTVVVPTFRVMWSYRGSLVIGNLLGAPGMVRISEPGFPGTFLENSWVYPDTGGAAVTGGAEHAGRNIAFTDNAVYDITDPGSVVALAQGIGCVAPGSVRLMPSGALVWLGRDGFYAMTPDGEIRRVSDTIRRTVQRGLNATQMSHAVAGYDYRSNEYRCAVAPSGSGKNTLLLCYDGAGWRRQELGIDIRGITAVNGAQRYMLSIGSMVGGAGNHVFVHDREVPTFDPAARSWRYRSAWIRADAIGLQPVNVRFLYVGFLDSDRGNWSVKFYKNMETDPVDDGTDAFLAMGTDYDGFSSVAADALGVATIGDAALHEPRLFWRKVPVDGNLNNVFSWSFEITADYPTRARIAAFAFDQSLATTGDKLAGRIPGFDE